MLDPQYLSWISQNIEGTGYGQCSSETAAMQVFFPELSRVRGHYIDAFWGPRTHWWLTAPDGTIVDPTKAQFPDQDGEYKPLDETAEHPTGKCPNCGGYCYGGKDLCSDECYRDYAAYVTAAARGDL